MLDREEYVEQTHFFRTLAERLKESTPIQDVLLSVQHELLVTTKLPMAIGFMLSELKHVGGFKSALEKLPHYFTQFQTFVVDQAEDDRGRFDFRIALQILWREAEYRSNSPSLQGIFLYQLETLCRNRLNYDRGLAAIANDPIFDERWRHWILIVRRQIGLVDLADMLYVRSEHYFRRAEKSRISAKENEFQDEWAPLFGEREGRIAWASRRKDPLLLFSALQRQLGYPQVPKIEPPDSAPQLIPQMARRLERLEARVKFLEDEQRQGIDITKFYGGLAQKPDDLEEKNNY